MNGRSALKTGIRDLFSNNRAARKERMEESHYICYLFEENHDLNWIQSQLYTLIFLKEIKACL